MFAIQNIKTGKFVYGTDYRYHPPKQRTSDKQMLIAFLLENEKCKLSEKD